MQRCLVPLLTAVALLSACQRASDPPSGFASRGSVRVLAAEVPVAVQYVRLDALSEVNGAPWASVAEFNLLDANGVISRSGWQVSADSQETVGEYAPATAAIDGNPGTFWHTQWQGTSPPYPHNLTINLGTPRSFSAFRYLPRQNGINGRIASWRFLVSADGVSWTQLTQGSFPNAASEITVPVSLGTASNRAPTFASIASRTDSVGQSVSQMATAVDPDGDALTFSVTGLPPGLAINSTSGLISGSPTAAGSYTPVLQAGDGRGGIASTSFSWTIASAGGNSGTAQYVRLEATSEINGNPWTSMAEFNLLDVYGTLIPRSGWQVSADSQEVVGENTPATNALDGNPNTFWHTKWEGTGSALPHTLTVNLGVPRGIGAFRYLPRQSGLNGRIAGWRFYSSNDGTTWTLIGQGSFVNNGLEASVPVTIPGGGNRAPAVSIIANRSDTVGQSVSQGVNASDPDGDTLGFSAMGLPSGLTINAANGTISGVPAAAGSFNVTVAVSDGRITASTSFVWTIQSTPIASGGANARFVRLEALSEINGKPWTSMAEFNLLDGNGLLIPRTGWQVSADSQEVTGENTPASNAVDGNPNTFWHSKWEGTGSALPHTFTVDLGTTRAVSAFRYLPRQGGLNGRIAAWRFYLSNDGVNWTVVAQGNFGTADSEATTVFSAPANRAPILLVPADRSDMVGAAATQAISASDPDGDTLSFTAAGLPPGLTINPASGAITGVPAATGSYRPTVEVRDGRTGSASVSFSWTIQPASGGGSTTYRYVRLEALSEVNGNPWTSIAEFDVLDTNSAVMSRTGWSVVADSEELIGEIRPATQAIDGNADTFWHTQWNGANGLPHTLTVDMGSARSIGGFRYLPRQIGSNGRIAKWRFYVSLDGNSWLLAAQGTFTDSAAVQTQLLQLTAIVNRAPLLASLPITREDTLGASTTLTLSAIDPDGDVLSYSASGLPTGLQINPNSGVISGAPIRADTFYTSVQVSDSRGGTASRAFNWVITAPVTSAGATGSAPPVIFNSPATASLGDVIGIQGEGFGGSPRVVLDGYGADLEIVNRVGTGWLAVKLPTVGPTALTLRIATGTGTSAPLRLNAALATNLDVSRLAPGATFRVYGHSLRVAGATPSIAVNGRAAVIDLARSDARMITAIAPSDLSPGTTAAITVDNGNGSGSSQLDRSVTIVASGGDAFGLGVGWAAAFDALAGRAVFAASDTRISDQVRCDGTHDDTNGVRQAIDLAAAAGGGVVMLPAGRCWIAGGLVLRSNIVLRGAGKAGTELVYGPSAYPIYAVGIDLAGVRDLTLTNSGQALDAMILKSSTRVFIQNVRVRLGTSRQMFLDGNTDIVVRDSDFEQSAGVSGQGPYTFANCRGLVFENNVTTWSDGSPTFSRLHDSYVHANRFTRDAAHQTDGSSGSVHSLTLDFAYRVAIVGNTLDVKNGPVTNKQRNDGEALLTEGGGGMRTESVGTVGSATRTTLTDPAGLLSTNPFGDGVIPENYGVAIVAGKGAGQMRRLISYGRETRTLTVDQPWDVVPDASSRYAAFVFGLEKSFLGNNILTQNPRGIWLYQTAMRDVDVVDNVISDGGGIFVRSYQKLSAGIFTPIYGLLIEGNRISNSTSNWPSYINVAFVNGDGFAYGTGVIGIAIRRNEITANRPNLVLPQEDHSGTEGMAVSMPLESGGYYESSSIPRMLGTILDGNTCNNCETALRTGTGAAGTTMVGTQLTGGGQLYSDTSTVPSGERSTATVVR